MTVSRGMISVDHSSSRRDIAMKVRSLVCSVSGASNEVRGCRKSCEKGMILGNIRNSSLSRGMISVDHSSSRRDIAMKVGFLVCSKSGASNDVVRRGNGCEKGPILDNIRNSSLSRRMIFDDCSSSKQDLAMKVSFLECSMSVASNEVRGCRKS